MKEKLEAEIKGLQHQIDIYKGYVPGDNIAGKMLEQVVEMHVEQLENLKRLVEILKQDTDTDFTL